MSVHWFWMDLQSVNSLFQESKMTTTSTPMLLSNETFVTSTTEFPVSSLKIWPRAGFLAGAHYLQLQLPFWSVGILAIPQKMSSFSCQRVPGNCACEDCFEWRVCFVCLVSHIKCCKCRDYSIVVMLCWYARVSVTTRLTLLDLDPSSSILL